MKIISRWLVLITLLLLNNLSLASVSDDLNHFFNNLGYSTNVTDSEAYKSQNAGYYTGGSLFARNRVRDAQLASIQLPSFRGGCGGIDLFAGGFSYINSKELVEALKNVANNATSYAFMLAVETVSPMIAEQMKNLQNLANQINQTNINSCETATGLVGALWPKTDLAQKQVCESIGTSNGLFTDWAQARQQCGSGGERSKTLAQGQNDPAYKDLVIQNGNLAWQAIQKNPFLSSDPQLAELFMSLSGTLIIHQKGNNDNATNQFIHLPSLATNNDLIKALMQGGQATIYRCDDSKQCLNPTKTTLLLENNHTFGNHVKTLLQGMVDKIVSDTKLSPEEIGLLQTTRLPVYKMLNVNAAYAKDTSVMDITAYSDVIASDILYQYLMENLNVVLASSSSLQFPNDIMEQFRSGIVEARNQVIALRNKTLTDVATTFDMVQKTQLIEQQLAGMLSADLAGSLTWANGLH